MVRLVGGVTTTAFISPPGRKKSCVAPTTSTESPLAPSTPKIASSPQSQSKSKSKLQAFKITPAAHSETTLKSPPLRKSASTEVSSSSLASFKKSPSKSWTSPVTTPMCTTPLFSPIRRSSTSSTPFKTTAESTSAPVPTNSKVAIIHNVFEKSPSLRGSIAPKSFLPSKSPSKSWTPSVPVSEPKSSLVSSVGRNRSSTTTSATTISSLPTPTPIRKLSTSPASESAETTPTAIHKKIISTVKNVSTPIPESTPPPSEVTAAAIHGVILKSPSLRAKTSTKSPSLSSSLKSPSKSWTSSNEQPEKNSDLCSPVIRRNSSGAAYKQERTSTIFKKGHDDSNAVPTCGTSTTTAPKNMSGSRTSSVATNTAKRTIGAPPLLVFSAKPSDIKLASKREEERRNAIRRREEAAQLRMQRFRDEINAIKQRETTALAATVVMENVNGSVNTVIDSNNNEQQENDKNETGYHSSDESESAKSTIKVSTSTESEETHDTGDDCDDKNNINNNSHIHNEEEKAEEVTENQGETSNIMQPTSTEIENAAESKSESPPRKSRRKSASSSSSVSSASSRKSKKKISSSSSVGSSSSRKSKKKISSTSSSVDSSSEKLKKNISSSSSVGSSSSRKSKKIISSSSSVGSSSSRKARKNISSSASVGSSSSRKSRKNISSSSSVGSSSSRKSRKNTSSSSSVGSSSSRKGRKKISSSSSVSSSSSRKSKKIISSSSSIGSSSSRKARKEIASSSSVSSSPSRRRSSSVSSSSSRKSKKPSKKSSDKNDDKTEKPKRAGKKTKKSTTNDKEASDPTTSSKEKNKSRKSSTLPLEIDTAMVVVEDELSLFPMSDSIDKEWDNDIRNRRVIDEMATSFAILGLNMDPPRQTSGRPNTGNTGENDSMNQIVHTVTPASTSEPPRRRELQATRSGKLERAPNKRKVQRQPSNRVPEMRRRAMQRDLMFDSHEVSTSVQSLTETKLNEFGSLSTHSHVSDPVDQCSSNSEDETKLIMVDANDFDELSHRKDEDTLRKGHSSHCETSSSNKISAQHDIPARFAQTAKALKTEDAAKVEQEKRQLEEQRAKVEEAREAFQRGHDLCWKAMDSSAALQEYRKALLIRESLLGKFHEETGRSYFWIGKSLVKLREYEEALVAYTRAMRIFDRVLMRSHKYNKWTALAVESVFKELEETGEHTGWSYDKYKTCIEASIEHEKTGDAYRKRGQSTHAIAEYRVAIDNIEDYHPDAADLYCKIAIIMRQQGQFDHALEEYRYASEIYELSLGAEHPETVKTLNQLYEKKRLNQVSLALMEKLKIRV